MCEQPVAAEEFLSFEDKYMSGGRTTGMKGAQRLIPAPISEALTEPSPRLGQGAFTAFGCAGVTRVDFLIDDRNEVYVNELNTDSRLVLLLPVGARWAALRPAHGRVD